MDYASEIDELLDQRFELKSAYDRVAVVKQAINIADAHNDLEWAFQLRIDLIHEEIDTSSCTESFPAFTWLLDAYDNNPDTFDERDFLWEYKWMLGSAKRNSSISMQDIEHILEDYKVRLLRNGYSLRAYYTVKTNIAFFLGDLKAARENIDLRDKEQRDGMANCRACELHDNVELELRLGNLDKALVVGHDMLTRKVTCAHMPFSCYCMCAKYFAKAGESEKAYDFFLKAEKDLKKLEKSDDNSMVSQIADIIIFLTDYDKEQAWQYFEKYAHWNNDSEEYLDFLFCLAVMPLLKNGGTKQLTVSVSLPWYSENGTYDTEKLYNFYHKKANELANKFDRRNGSDYFNKQIQATIDKFIV